MKLTPGTLLALTVLSGLLNSSLAAAAAASTNAAPEEVSNVFSDLKDSEIAVYNFQGSDFKLTNDYGYLRPPPRPNSEKPDTYISYGFEIGTRDGHKTKCNEWNLLENAKFMVSFLPFSLILFLFVYTPQKKRQDSIVR